MAVDGFSADVARRIVGISYRQLDYWDKTGLLRPSIKQARGKGSRRVYSFEDLVELRVVAGLLQLGIPLPTVRKAARYVRQHFSDVVRPLARLALVVEGKCILVKASDKKEFIDATAGGQVVVSLEVEPIARELRGKVIELASPRHVPVRVGHRTYTAVLTPDLAEGGYTIEVPELPGVVTEADTVQQARRMAADAIRLWLSASTPAQKRRVR